VRADGLARTTPGIRVPAPFAEHLTNHFGQPASPRLASEYQPLSLYPVGYDFVMDHTYQAIVRGRFENLLDSSRAVLLREAGSHDLLSAKFTEEGTFTYDESLLAFTFRYLVTSPENADEDRVTQIAVRKSVAFLEAAQYGYRDLKPVATDLDEVRVRRNG
jgi:hypothetical protein